ncbi:Transcription antitermination protein NusB [Dirofilaria immitis]
MIEVLYLISWDFIRKLPVCMRNGNEAITIAKKFSTAAGEKQINVTYVFLFLTVLEAIQNAAKDSNAQVISNGTN